MYNFNYQLLGLLDDVPADDLKPVHLKRYFVYCFERPIIETQCIAVLML